MINSLGTTELVMEEANKYLHHIRKMESYPSPSLQVYQKLGPTTVA